MKENERPRVSLIKERVANVARSDQGVLFDRVTNARGQEFLVARGGDLSRTPTFKASQENANTTSIDVD